VPIDECRSIDALIRQLDFHGDELADVERDIAIEAIDDPVVARLMTVPGIDVTVAIAIVAAVGDFARFTNPNSLVNYLGLNPKVRQSGNAPAAHGRITKAGPAQARGMLVEAALSAARAPGPLRAFYRRVRDRRGFQIATVATARKMIVLCWHLIDKGEDYAFARPSLTAHNTAPPRARRWRHLTTRARSRGQPRLPHQAATRPGSRPRRTRRAGLRSDGHPLAATETNRNGGLTISSVV
jgi:hypothetical protein